MRTTTTDVGHLLAAGAIYLLLGMAMSAICCAQEPGDGNRAATRAVSVAGSACGLAEVGGELWGAGPDYRIHFGARAVEFTPALGTAVPQTTPLRLALTSMGRREAPPRALPPGRRSSKGYTVRYARPGFDEVYEVRADGVEQSFELRELPPGSGDLVVRLALVTELPLTSRATDEIRFEKAGVGGVRIGAVTGIDARGERVAGTLRYAEGSLELSLPAAWVDRAALPLIVDPLIGTVLRIQQPSDDSVPDIAHDSTNDLYFVVWERRFSQTDIDVRGQAVRPDGQLVGGLVQVRTSLGIRSRRPSVANVRVRGAFIAVWEEIGGTFTRPTIRSATIWADTLSVSLPAGLGPGINVDIANEDADNDVIAVWFDSGRVRAARLRIGLPGARLPTGPVSFGHTTIARARIYSDPRVSPWPGAGGRHLITWDLREDQPFDRDVHGIVVDRNLARLTISTRIAFTGDPECCAVSDGDGTTWTVVWQADRGLPVGVGNDWDLRSRIVWYDEAVGAIRQSEPMIVIEADPGRNDAWPHVAWLGDSALVVYEDEAGSGSDVQAWSIDPFQCLPCEGKLGVHVGSEVSTAPRIAAHHAGGRLTGNAMIAWSARASSSATSDVLVQAFLALDGSATDLGGGCGRGGQAYATCPITGNAVFTMRVRGAVPMAPASLVLGARRLDAPCGSCVLVPDPFSGFVIGAGLTDGFGDVEVSVAIPGSAGLVGLTLFQQWVIGGGSSCGNRDFSNALQVQIQ